jgi:hypothetical protein
MGQQHEADSLAPYPACSRLVGELRAALKPDRPLEGLRRLRSLLVG